MHVCICVYFKLISLSAIVLRCFTLVCQYVFFFIIDRSICHCFTIYTFCFSVIFPSFFFLFFWFCFSVSLLAYHETLQKDNVRNQRENVVLTVANAQSRLGVPGEADPVSDGDDIFFFGRLFHSLVKMLPLFLSVCHYFFDVELDVLPYGWNYNYLVQHDYFQHSKPDFFSLKYK